MVTGTARERRLSGKGTGKEPLRAAQQKAVHEYKQGGADMNIEDYSLTREELVVATAIHAYLEKLEPEARRATMSGIVHRDINRNVHSDGVEMVIDDRKLAALIETAKVAAMVSVEGWKDGTGVYQRSLKFIRKELPAVSGESYAQNISEHFAKFVEDCAA